jgi:hypothetical protein
MEQNYEATNNFSQHSQSSSWDLNKLHPEYIAVRITSTPWYVMCSIFLKNPIWTYSIILIVFISTHQKWNSNISHIF